MAIHISRTHHLDRATARKKVEEVAAALAEELHLRYAWEGDRLVFKRAGTHGHIELGDAAVHVYVKKGPLVPVSEGRIREQIETQLDAYLAGADEL